jgi:Xaa-Pro aminopeptidase
MREIATKLNLVRQLLAEHKLAGLHLRGVDWFAWATGGGSNVVILSTEDGCADILITPDQALVLTDSMEAERLQAEEIPPEYTVWAAPWPDTAARAAFVRAATADGVVASDRPHGREQPLPAALVAARRRLLPAEIERYRRLGALTASAVTEVLTAARADWTERNLAGAAAEALWSRGIHPTLTLAGGERRLPLYGHVTPTGERLGGRAMLVVCARQHGLYANMTRFVQFRPPTAEEQTRAAVVAQIEAVAWRGSRPGAVLADIHQAIVAEYAAQGYAGAQDRLHQGGTTGYLSREVVARPGALTAIEANTALAWNPSLFGQKIEDTILATEQGLEILTVDAAWPTIEINGYPRPLPFDAA